MHLRRNILLAIVAIIVWVVITMMVFNGMSSSENLTYDFYPHYVGGRTVWSQSTPYTDEVTQEIQMGMFGYLLAEDVDQQRFSYPAYSSVMIAPFLVFPAAQSMAAWTSFQLVSILVAILLMFPLLKWRPLPMMLFFIVFCFGFLFRHPINTFILGQFTGVMLLLLVGGFLCLLHKKDMWAGILFALAVNPPTIAGPLTVSILGVYLLMGRWKGSAAYIVTLGTATLISIVLIGWWIPDFIDNLSVYSQYAESVWLVKSLPIVLAIPMVIFVLASAGWFLSRLRNNFSWENQIDVFMAFCVISLLVLPQTGAYYMVLLIPPMIVTLYRAEKIQPRMRWAIRGTISVIVLSVWWFFFNLGEHTVLEAVTLPMSVLIIYYVPLNLIPKTQ